MLEARLVERFPPTLERIDEAAEPVDQFVARPAAERNRIGWYWVWLALAIIWKEDLALLFIGLGLLYLIRRRWRLGAATIAVAITVQQLSVLFVIALVPFMFREPFERMNLRFFAGAAMVVVGACLVVLL